MPPKHSTIRRPQFGLRTLVVGGLLVGAIAGMYGPTIVESIRTWLAPAPLNVQQPFVLPIAPTRDWDSKQTGYFESAETPLR
jgi:hypothetical protein